MTDFHHQLCSTSVLDPACGSGNFLYVAMARMKELEAEVLDLLAEIAPNDTLTAEMDKFKVRPDQFLGLEINERATAIAQLVLWIGYFQWQQRTTGKADTNDRPLLPRQATIECRDAVLEYDEK
ncbi:MAG: DNA methyltransferase, partial [Verrucomicrobiota bacterium]